MSKEAQTHGWQSKELAEETEVAKRRVDTITQKRTFEYFDKPTVGASFFFFKSKGDTLEGELFRGPIANVQRNSSYAIKTKDGVVEIFANRLLHACFQKCAVGDHVRIVYVGRDFTGQGHATKVYRFYVIRKVDERLGRKK